MPAYTGGETVGDRGVVYILMEHGECGNLVRRVALPEVRALQWLERHQILRDVSTENVACV